MKYQQLTNTLEAVDKRPEAWESPDGSRILMLPYGGRVLGLGAICNDYTVEKFTPQCTGMLEAPAFDRLGNLCVADLLTGVIWRAKTKIPGITLYGGS